MPEDKSCVKEEKTAYAVWMAETVEPYLKEHGEKGYLKMEDGMSIAYRRYSLPDAGKCVVISHGFCEFAEKYNEVAYRFLQAGYSVYVPEHRGHGYSGREVDDPELVHVQSYDSYVTDFARFVETVVSPGRNTGLYLHIRWEAPLRSLHWNVIRSCLRRQFSPHRCAPCRPENIRGLLHGC